MYPDDPFIANNRPTTLKAILKEDGTIGPVPDGQTVTLTLGSGGNLQSCTGQTQADGSVSCLIPNVNQPLGNQPVSATFTGDNYYSSSQDSSQQRLVFSYLAAGGGFALGDGSATVGTSDTWWGAQWWKLNNLSGGSAPASFKGFVQTFSSGAGTSDPVCSGSWTTRPGDSSGPPATVPTYMAVVVSSQVTKSGSTISGNISKIVIVKTNAGYGPDPSQTGAGTVVGTLCP